MRVSQGSSVVYLRTVEGPELVVPVHIGEAESAALVKEINKQRAARPLTHDVTKSLLLATGFRVAKVRALVCLRVCLCWGSRVYVW